ncbi:FtsW/RodA/SpoVE family cell cycle protein [Massilia sp.]|uniref:FtsW/RodA/SpoVE family cell cycle protein n=1 Tax=Massilia sp. TaxID=1882437 RepID=UPI0028B034A4|nr:FtsW/RodA/SpoVE family cell cycle protein [Massilia sp.]
MMGAPRPGFGLGMLAAAALALLCALQALAVLRMPSAFSPSDITITLAPGHTIELGRAELAAPQADPRHLRLRRDSAGRWFIASASGMQGLRIEHGADGTKTRSGALALQAGQRFQLGAAQYTVETAHDGLLRLKDGAHTWEYDGAVLRQDGSAQGACPQSSLGARLLGFWNRILPAFLGFERPLGFGGNLSCATTIGNPDAAPGNASIAFVDGVPTLFAASGSGRVPLLAEVDGLPADLALRELPLDGASALGVGRTRLLAAIDGDTLRLQPVSRVALFPDTRTELPEGVSWRWAPRNSWLLPSSAPWAGAVALASGLLAGLLGWRTAFRKQPALALRLGAGVALAIAGFALLLAVRAGQAPGAAPTLLLAWAALWYGLQLRRPNAVLTTGVLLLAGGLLLQLELGTAATDTSWMRHFQKTAAATTLGLGLTGLAGLLKARRPASQAQVEWTLLALACCAVVALLVQVGWGSETGVFDLQPVEFAKLALTVLTAHCIALGLGAGDTGSSARKAGLLRWLRLASPALLFIVLLAVALVQVDDYSPLILLLVWGAAMLLAWSLAARQRAATVALCLLAVGVIGAVGLLRATSPDDIAHWNFYGERFLVWLDPAAHPHTGQQLLLGARAILAGGWMGADGVFGLAALGASAPDALAIPAVQDDFAPSFFLNRHGLLAALGLWTLQALFLCALLGAALRAWSGAAGARDFRHAWQARFRCFVLCGGAAFVFGHFLLSWGTNLSFFPIMGQPMSFLSAGGSHLLFFIFPLLAFGAAAPSSKES